ncbi:hypothetical protein GCM10022393_29680 [Aquimarina addita]|uniref:Tetratricopeptide repeat protein n=1 Tax=Aquimarina addita TaxID=870485 RepID=A0ABP6US22_9FLAO
MSNQLLISTTRNKKRFHYLFIKIISCISYVFLLTGVYGYNSIDSPLYCGGGDWIYEDEYFKILDSKILTDPTLSSFLYCPEYLFCDKEKEEITDRNITEWEEYFTNSFTAKELKSLIYTSTVVDIKEIISGKNTQYKDRFKKIGSDKRNIFLNYLLFAKRNQRVQSGKETYNSWYQGESENPDALDKEELLVEAFELYAKEKDRFIKNRYAFQIIRLCHYLGKNEEALKVFDSYLVDDKKSNYIFYRSLEQKAGVLYNLKEFEKSISSFLEVYKELPDRRETCASSIRLLLSKTEKSNAISYHLQKENQEVFRFFNTFYNSSSELVEAERLANMNPDSSYLELIIMRIAEQLQHDLFIIKSTIVSDHYDYLTNNRFDTKYINRLETIVSNQLNINTTKNMDLWKIHKGFLSIYQGEMQSARAILAEISEQSRYFAQAQRLVFISKVLTINEQIDRNELNQLYIETQKNKHIDNNCYDFFINHVALVYKSNQNEILAILMSQEKSNLVQRHYVLEKSIEAFQQFLDIPDKTDFENHILSLLPPKNPQDYIYEMRGTMFFRSNQLEQAIAQYQSIEKQSDYYDDGIRSMIFSGAIREFFDVPFEEQNDLIAQKYSHFFTGKVITDEYHHDNKLLLAKTLLKIEAAAQRNPDKAGEYYYMLGNAWYNLSERGWFPGALNYIYNDERYELFYYDTQLDQLDDYSSMQHADAYYKLAQNTSSNEEIKAKSTFMLAKIHPCYNIYGDYNDQHLEFCGDHSSYFEILSKQYADTQFMKEVIKECSYYRHYLN